MSGQLQQWKLMPNSIKKVAKVGSKILPITKKPLKIANFYFFVKAGIFSISGHTDKQLFTPYQDNSSLRLIRRF